MNFYASGLEARNLGWGECRCGLVACTSWIGMVPECIAGVGMRLKSNLTDNSVDYGSLFPR